MAFICAYQLFGSWKGSYGIPSALQTVNKIRSIHSIVLKMRTWPGAATFEKLDGSTRQVLLVEIFKNGNLLTPPLRKYFQPVW